MGYTELEEWTWEHSLVSCGSEQGKHLPCGISNRGLGLLELVWNLGFRALTKGNRLWCFQEHNNLRAGAPCAQHFLNNPVSFAVACTTFMQPLQLALGGRYCCSRIPLCLIRCVCMLCDSGSPAPRNGTPPSPEHSTRTLNPKFVEPTGTYPNGPILHAPEKGSYLQTTSTHGCQTQTRKYSCRVKLTNSGSFPQNRGRTVAASSRFLEEFLSPFYLPFSRLQQTKTNPIFLSMETPQIMICCGSLI